MEVVLILTITNSLTNRQLNVFLTLTGRLEGYCLPAAQSDIAVSREISKCVKENDVQQAHQRLHTLARLHSIKALCRWTRSTLKHGRGFQTLLRWRSCVCTGYTYRNPLRRLYGRRQIISLHDKPSQSHMCTRTVQIFVCRQSRWKPNSTEQCQYVRQFKHTPQGGHLSNRALAVDT